MMFKIIAILNIKPYIEQTRLRDVQICFQADLQPTIARTRLDNQEQELGSQ